MSNKKIKLPADFLQYVALWPVPVYHAITNSASLMYTGEVIAVGLVVGSLVFRLTQFDDLTGLIGMYLAMGTTYALTGPWLAKVNGETWPKP